jgi:hypothetical protein
MKSHYKHIFFDLDGTLWDFRTNAIHSLREIFALNQLERFYPTFEDFHKLYAPCNHSLWDAYARSEVTKDFLIVERFHAPLRAVGNNDIELAKKLSHDFLTTLSQQNVLMPFAREVLNNLHNKTYLISTLQRLS